MHQFCFNDCIPTTSDIYSLTECLELTLTEYNKVKKSFPENVDGIITSSSLSKLLLDEYNHTLSDCIASIKSKDLRIFAYRIFTRYPIEKYYTVINEDDLLVKEYSLTVAGTNHSAINPVIVSENNGVLFTLGLHDDLKKDVLTISSNTLDTVDVSNLFGSEGNTSFITNLIHQSITVRLGNFEKLLELIGTNVYSPRFKKGFDDITSQIQDSIIEHFEKAIKREGVTPLFADKVLIRDVTPEKVTFKIYELRIFSPVPFRVYFYEAINKTYLALIEKKPQEKKQSSHISAAASIIGQLILLGK